MLFAIASVLLGLYLTNVYHRDGHCVCFDWVVDEPISLCEKKTIILGCVKSRFFQGSVSMTDQRQDEGRKCSA